MTVKLRSLWRCRLLSETNSTLASRFYFILIDICYTLQTILKVGVSDSTQGNNMSEQTNWQVEALRITAFPENNTSALWKQCVGKEPTDIRIQRTETREVKYKNGRIFLIEHPGRIEWQYLAKQDDNEPLRLPIIGSLEEELDVIVELARKWLNLSDKFQLNRLAFGAVLLNPVESMLRGYENLQEFLPFLASVDLSENSSDFNYQVNRQRNSKIIAGLPINRLTRWSVIRLKQFDLTQTRVTDLNLVASRLELDINTSPDRISSLPSADLANLFDELVQMGLELSEKGDIE